jgi:hypothetical protein
MAPFGCADKPAEKHCWLICCERKILFRLKKQAKKTDYKPDEQSLYNIPHELLTANRGEASPTPRPAAAEEN